MSLNVKALERSLEQIKPVDREFTASFYDKLFEDYPEVKPLFAHSDMFQQRKKLFDALVLVVENINNPNELSQEIKKMGKRHTKYGVLPHHYPWVGSTLLKTFEHYLGTDWTTETSQAWSEAYNLLSQLMSEKANNGSEDSH